MDPTTCQQPQIAIPSGQSLHGSLLSGSMGWNHTISSSWQSVPHRIPWIRQGQRLVNFAGVQRARCRARSIAIKRHLESGDQEPSSKHFLSEDKMAARFNSLSLDNDHIYGSNGFPIQDEDSTWQEAYLRLKELQRRLSQDGTTEETGSTDEENELNSVIVDGEFLMADCPMLTHPSHLQEVLGGVSLVPEETFLSLNPCTEVVLWSPPGNSVLHTIRTLMAVPSSLSPSTQPQQDVGLTQEEMEI
ncbi:uncharacterized protein LOC128329491 isoform X2 [Hemicordylus capensis]|uniref:uncharacterized protein LOC128329491 isoform X2 n=1 Tax=Hemicordylus capensis TaxID=884348 RepID=UPI00230259B1|nr:uncharacterized protein LOC128329491 isoform X2 [Hemicordylus capensis]XP_053116800.1 uncharacterized protein LOC128329491 isoform X2 [Hemicordylus capensis]